MDFLIRETVRDESLIAVAASSPNLMEETALHILENWRSPQILAAVFENRKLLEKSPAVASKIAELARDEPALRQQIDGFEESLLQGQGESRWKGRWASAGWVVSSAPLVRGLGRDDRFGGVKQSGRVFFRRGRVIGAVWGDLEGLAAIEAILKTPDLKFRYSLRTHFQVENVDPIAAEELLRTPAAGPSAAEEGQTWLRLMSGSPEAMDILEVLSPWKARDPHGGLTLCEEGSARSLGTAPAFFMHMWKAKKGRWSHGRNDRMEQF